MDSTTNNLKTVIVTGASNGLGLESVKKFAKDFPNYRIIMACRNIPKATSLKDSIEKETNHKNLIVMEIDTSSLASVQNFVKNYKNSSYGKIYGLSFGFSNVIETYGVSANHDNDNIIHAISKKEEEKEKTWAEMIDESTDKKVYGTFNPNYIELIIHGKRNDYKRYEETADPTEEVINLLNHPRANETIMATEKIIESFFPNTMRFIREKVLPRYDNITRRGYSTNDVFDIYVDRFKRSMCDIPDHDVLVKNLSVS